MLLPVRSLLCSVTSLAAVAAAPSNCRLYLASQYQWETKQGFYLDFEGSTLSELPVILGVANGQEWRFASHRPGFVVDRDYRILAVIGPQQAEIQLDGTKVAELEMSYRPAPGPLLVNDRPGWARDPGDWLALIRDVKVTVRRDGAELPPRSFAFPATDAKALPLLLFEPGQTASADLATNPGDTVTVEVNLRFARAEIRPFAPFIDRYGQCRYAEFATKVTDEAQLQADTAAEDAELAQMPPSPDFDEFGGYLRAGWSEPPAGFFRTARHDGKWWLITPAGNPCFFLGVSSVPAQVWETSPVSGREFLFEWLPPREGPFAPAWSRNQWGGQDGTEYVCFYTCNLVRKYGAGWSEAAKARALRRLRAWGFGGGKWGAPPELVQTPVLGRWKTPSLAGHPDVFDPAGCEAFRRDLAEQIAPRRDDPRILGWSLGNEYDEIIKRAEVRDVLAKPATTAAKRALIDQALSTIYGDSVERLATTWQVTATDREALYAATALKPSDADVESLRRFYADRYYGFIYRTVKALDPNHLYLGFWIVPGWWEHEEDWRLSARYCDVLGYDRYHRDYRDERVARLEAEIGKPVFVGEFSLPPWYEGRRGYGQYPTWARDEQEAADLYEQWVRNAARDPYCVGLVWFLYRDQPITGRGPGRGEQLAIGEHYAFGLVTETDRVKWPLVRRMREVNLNAAKWRLE